MKILYLCHRVPYPPDKGEKIRAYHHLAHLSRRHQVHVGCLADTDADLDHARSLESMVASVDVVFRSPLMARLHALAALPTGRPLSVAAFDSSELRAKIARRWERERPDAAIAYSAAIAPYVDRLPGAARVLDFVDADSEKFRVYGRVQPFPQSALYALEADRLLRFERAMAARFDASIFISEAEADIVCGKTPGSRVAIIRNGVDLDAFRPDPSPSPKEPILVFTGVMGYFPNVDAVSYFAQSVLPRVRERIPDARFDIVGRDPSMAVRRLAQKPGVTVTGAVADVRPYLARSAVAVAPFRIARGVQNKVLEAMAAGLPVVGTPIAFQGIQATGADGIRIADSPDALAGAVVTLLEDPALRRTMGEGARRYVERHHRWDEVGAFLEEILQGAVKRRAERDSAREKQG